MQIKHVFAISLLLILALEGALASTDKSLDEKRGDFDEDENMVVFASMANFLALKHWNHDNFREAALYFLIAAEIYEQSYHNLEIPDCYYNAAGAEFMMNEYIRAAKLFILAGKHFVAHDRVAIAYEKAAISYALAKQYILAAECFRKGAEAYEEADDHQCSMSSFEKSLHMLHLEGELCSTVDETINVLLMRIEIYSKLNRQIDIATCYTLLGEIYLKMDRIDKPAIYNYQAARALEKE